MAKRAAPDEKPYRPLLDADLVSAALSQAGPTSSPVPAAAPPVSSPKVVEMHRPEPVRREAPTVDLETVAETISRTLEIEKPRPVLQPLVEKFDQEKRILFTRSESQAIDRMVVALATRLNAQVKVSHVVRALVGLLLNAEAEVDRRAGETPPLTRPANGDAKALQNFEREIARIIQAGLRDAGPLR
jgi:hypothetical protein